MSIRLALAGNPNSGKTTMFNALTGSNQRVGNWPGVTVEKKEGRLKSDQEVTLTDLPGIYSLSPYTLEEVVAREYLVGERPDGIINIVDATNIERNLYLTTQLMEMGIPVVVALNMMDLVRKNGDSIDAAKLSKALGCPVAEVSALKGEGLDRLITEAKRLQSGSGPKPLAYSPPVEAALDAIQAALGSVFPKGMERWYAVKVFERDDQVMGKLTLSADVKGWVEQAIVDCETALDDDAESIITNERYEYIAKIVAACVKKKRAGLSLSDKIDRVVTNRIAALPIFVVVMALVYSIAMGGWTISIGTHLTDWANDGLFGDGWFVPFTVDAEAWDEDSGAFEEASAIIAAYEAGESEAYLYDDETGDTAVLEVNEQAYQEALTVPEPEPTQYGAWVPGIPVLMENGLTAIGCNEIVASLILDGIVGGVGAVLGFVPQMLVLFLLLAILEDVGYMSRIAFIMDRIFRRFGLSGKSFIPMLVATGCGVPGIMASRTIEQDRDRKMTIMTTGFIPCGAKMPIIALFAGALFGHSPLVATSAYFIGVAAVVISGIILKKFKAFAGEPAPFVMELPAYHAPNPGNVLRSMWERGWSFIKRAGTVILVSTIVLWFLQGFGFENGAFGMVEDNNHSILANIGNTIAWIFAPLGFGTWQATVATITGLIAKEEVVSTMSVCYPGNLTANIGAAFTGIGAYSFMIFNLLCAPCFAAMGAIKREMNNAKWTLAAIGYMCAFAYVISLIVYQIGGLITGDVSFNLFTVVAIALAAGIICLLFRKGYRGETNNQRAVDAVKV
ncbi:MAG TPA: ferrous iron transporter B [Candidatus Enterenecus stercoripullorum]|nr:ferrous iron transporter B [Candidatus Enterenecus stercoripullorum]